MGILEITVGNTMVRVIKGDIAAQEVDAIVNAANTNLILGSGVAGAIRRGGGPGIQEECDKIGTIPFGGAAITTAGNLPSRFVIHAASMSFTQTTTAESLRESTKNSLLRAEEKNLETIAFPAIGTGVAGFPLEQCSKIMFSVVKDHLGKESSLKTVFFVLFDEDAFGIFSKSLKEM